MYIVARHPVTYEPASKYCHAPRPGWTWTPPVRQRFCPFSTIGEKLMLTICGSLMLALVVFMAR